MLYDIGDNLHSLVKTSRESNSFLVISYSYSVNVEGKVTAKLIPGDRFAPLL